MIGCSASRRSAGVLLVLALACGGGAAQAGQAECRSEEGARLAAAPGSAEAAPKARPRDDAEDTEDATVEIDPLLRLQLLSAIMLTSPNVLNSTSNISNVTRAPTTTSNGTPDTPPGGNVTPPGGPPPEAPEPAGQALGFIGGSCALVGFYVVRSRRVRSVA
jgi:hypothetical protein